MTEEQHIMANIIEAEIVLMDDNDWLIEFSDIIFKSGDKKAIKAFNDFTRAQKDYQKQIKEIYKIL